MTVLRKFVIVLLALAPLTACMNTRNVATETEKAQCEAFGSVLGTKSINDTERTRWETTERYSVFARVCPNHTHLIPE